MISVIQIGIKHDPKIKELDGANRTSPAHDQKQPHRRPETPAFPKWAHLRTLLYIKSFGSET